MDVQKAARGALFAGVIVGGYAWLARHLDEERRNCDLKYDVVALRHDPHLCLLLSKFADLTEEHQEAHAIYEFMIQEAEEMMKLVLGAQAPGSMFRANRHCCNVITLSDKFLGIQTGSADFLNQLALLQMDRDNLHSACNDHIHNLILACSP